MAIVHAINTLVGNAADRPAAAAGYKGLVFSALDTGVVSWCDGSNWFVLSVPGSTTTALFNNLDPLTTAGDILVHDGTDSKRQAIGSDMALLRADSTQTNGLAWARRPVSYCMFSVDQTAFIWTFPAGVGDPFGGANQMNLHKRDFSAYREGMIHVRARNAVTSFGNVNFRIFDVSSGGGPYQVTNATANFPNDGAWYTKSAANWLSLNSATYAGTAEFEMQVNAGAAADTVDIGTIILELR